MFQRSDATFAFTMARKLLFNNTQRSDRTI